MTALSSVLALLPEAEEAVHKHLHRTESRELSWLARYAGRPVIAKLETQQATGSFKARGAIVALSGLPPGTSVVAPSAGNHGLAVAWAAARLGLAADIVLPQNASPLKRERIARLGAGVIEAGGSVEQASAEARRLAERSRRPYISPFNDVAIIAGQATAVIEMLRDHPGIEMLVIPVGGGGLLSGAVAAREYLGRELALLGCEPAKFASMAASVRSGRYVRLGRQPTYADGLATNLEPGSVTLEIALGAADLTFCSVTEEQIAAGCAAIFNRESILAAGAAAAVVAALLGVPRPASPSGEVGVVLTGGNVHHGTFWQMLGHTPSSPELVAITDIFGRSARDDVPRRHLPEASHRMLAPPSIADDADTMAEVALPAALLDALGRYTAETSSMLEDVAGLAREAGLPLDDLTLEATRQVNDVVTASLPYLPVADTQAREQRLRALSQIAVAARLALEWRSPGYDQSAALSVFDLGALGSPGVNYARYDQPGVADVERQLERLLGISPQTHAVLVTSSGMAAFALATAVVLAETRVRAVLTAPYLYFEAMEMLRYWFGDAVHVAESYAPDDLAAMAAHRDADVVFADPLANHPDQRMVDVEHLAALLAADERERWLVCDASMLPAVTAGLVTRAMPQRALYYESCSKYLQFGLDIAMAGLVVVPRGLEGLARRMRRNLGLGIDRYGAELFPRYEPRQFERRLTRMEQAATLVGTHLGRTLPRDVCDVVFPGLPGHADHELAVRLGRTGSCLTLVPVGAQPGKDQLEPVVDAAVREAAKRKLPLVKGVSFGFSVSRLSAASAMAETAPPFLRLAVGVMDETSATLLADTVSRAVTGTCATWQH